MHSDRSVATASGSPQHRTVSARPALHRLSALLALIATVGLAATDDASAQYALRGPSASIGPRGPTIMAPIGPRFDPGYRYNRGGPYSIQSSDGPPPVSSANPLAQNSQSSGPRARRARNLPSANERRFVPNEVVIEVDGSPSQQQVNALARRHRLTRMESQSFGITGTTLFRWRIPDRRSVTTVLRELENDASIRSVQPNYVYTLQQNARAAGSEGDVAQYALVKLKLPQAHGVATGEHVLIAVVDSGIDVSHPELQGAIADTFDALGTDEPPHPHGTAIAGIIAAHARLMGAAPAVRILAVRAFGAKSKGAQGTTFNILKGLDWAIAHGARIVNMSFAGPPDPMLERSLANLKRKGTILVAAVGNAGAKSPPLYPAADPNVIAVTATDIEDKLFAAANRGRYVAVAAPGVDILVPTPGGGYQMSSGTSFAAAYVSGIAALLLERRPKLLPDVARRVLVSTAKDLGPKGRDDEFGAGLVNAFGAVMSFEPKTADTAPPQ
ncbi:MAG TPA: S8 family serine peptidase [Xanthobacteraceae bacterium]|nr:S8 family serine peptidase [Xanthobacteraceae bacterium]